MLQHYKYPVFLRNTKNAYIELREQQAHRGGGRYPAHDVLGGGYGTEEV